MTKKALKAQNRKQRAVIRAALMHYHGYPNLLLYKMRENWSGAALETLGFDSFDEFLAAEGKRVARQAIR